MRRDMGKKGCVSCRVVPETSTARISVRLMTVSMILMTHCVCAFCITRRHPLAHKAGIKRNH